MRIDIDEGNLQAGVLGLVLALVEIIQDALKTQALRRIEGGDLDDDEIERLGNALMDLEQTVTKIKVEQNLQSAVEQIRTGLDDVINEVVDIFNPQGWVEESDSERQ
jgi:hypothetical protein